MNSITVGMPRRDVVLFLGTPKKQHQEGFREVLEFPLHKDINDPYAPDESYWVFLEDGKVVKHGRGKDFKPAQQASGEDLNAQIRV